ncbi:MAG: Holliday junction branch migration protein RuvA [Bacteroidota bacterium]
MIAFLQGKLDSLEPTFAVIDCQGVGYLAKISLNTYQEIQGKKECKLFTYLQVREDAQILFGFSRTAERSLFEHLISVSGVGGNTALAILSSINPDDLLMAIANEDSQALKRVKGIGAKTAGRIILELKDKLKTDEIAGLGAGSTASPGLNTARKVEATKALMNLGFSQKEVNQRLEKIFKQHGQGLSVEEIIKLALRNT